MTVSHPEPYRPRIGRLILAITAVLAILIAAGLASGSASAAQITVSSSATQSGYNGLTSPAVPITSTPWDFTGQQYNQLSSIDSITVTLTVGNGFTDVAELDNGHWTLGLDGLNTGLHLDGFTGGQIVSLTISGPNNAAALLASLQSDGQLVGTIIDDTPGDNSIILPARLSASLDITGTLSSGGNGGGPGNVPLPAALLMAPVAASLAAWRSRRLQPPTA